MKEALDPVVEMAEAPIGRLLLKFSIPTIAMMLVNGLYNTIDQVFIGHGMGTVGIAAVTAAFPLMLLSVAIGSLFGAGATTLISISLGAGRAEEARSLLGQAFAASILAAAVIALLTLAFMSPVLRLLGATPALLPFARRYLSIVSIGFLFQIPSMATGGSLRAQGRPRAAVIAVICGVAVNAALAPLFIFGFHAGLAGAAAATVTAQAVVFVLTLTFIQGGKSRLRIMKSAMRPRAAAVGKMVTLGAPAALANIIQLAVFAVANTSIAAYGGDLGIAMVGIVNSLYRLFSFPVEGITQGAQALWGYNHGAGKPARVRSITFHAMAWATAVSVLCTLLIELFPRGFVSLFNASDAQFLRLGSHGLAIFFLGFFAYGARSVSAQFFQSVGRPAEATVLLLGRNVLLIAGMIVLPRWLALDGVLWAGSASEILTAAISVPLLARGLRNRYYRPHAGTGRQGADCGGREAPP
ncbi:MAG: MATE family efflux transporter [Spirochaetia bacterium]